MTTGLYTYSFQPLSYCFCYCRIGSFLSKLNYTPQILLLTYMVSFPWVIALGLPPWKLDLFAGFLHIFSHILKECCSHWVIFLNCFSPPLEWSFRISFENRDSLPPLNESFPKNVLLTIFISSGTASGTLLVFRKKIIVSDNVQNMLWISSPMQLYSLNIESQDIFK